MLTLLWIYLICQLAVSLLVYREIAAIIYGGFRCIRAQYRRSFNKERDYEEQATIHDKCFACEYRDGNLCGLCGCILSEKIPIKTEECPDGRW